MLESGVTIIRKGFGYKPADYGNLNELIEQFEISHKKRKAVTKEVLETWEPSRNNDILLFFECLRTEFPDIQVTSGENNIIFKFPRKDIKFFPSPESYLRARRSLNSIGIGLPTDPRVIKRRKQRERTLRKYFKDEN